MKIQLLLLLCIAWLTFPAHAMNKEEVTKHTILKNWCNKSLTSQMVESYVRARLKFRISYWQSQLQKWYTTWNIDQKDEVILHQLPEKCRKELQEIPFYIFYTRTNPELLEYLQKHHFKGVYIFSDKAAGIPDRLLNTAGFVDRNNIMFINESYDCPVSLRGIYLFLVIEHELTHTEQHFETHALEVCFKETKEKSLLTIFMYFISHSPTALTRHAYESYNYFQQKDEKFPYFSLKEWFNIIEKREGEADKYGIQFTECPIPYYHALLNVTQGCLNEKEYNSEKGYRPGGYYTPQKELQLFAERLFTEGYIKDKPYEYQKNYKYNPLICLEPPIAFSIQYVDENGFNCTILRSKL